MQVSMETILNKMEQELTHARKEQDTQKAREYVVAIRTLCELVLDEPVEKNETVFTKSVPATSIIAKQVYEEEDDANGNSLLDF